MAYERLVAVCKPLLYTAVTSLELCASTHSVIVFVSCSDPYISQVLCFVIAIFNELSIPTEVHTSDESVLSTCIAKESTLGTPKVFSHNTLIKTPKLAFLRNISYCKRTSAPAEKTLKRFFKVEEDQTLSSPDIYRVVMKRKQNRSCLKGPFLHKFITWDNPVKQPPWRRGEKRRLAIRRPPGDRTGQRNAGAELVSRMSLSSQDILIPQSVYQGVKHRGDNGIEKREKLVCSGGIFGFRSTKSIHFTPHINKQNSEAETFASHFLSERGNLACAFTFPSPTFLVLQYNHKHNRNQDSLMQFETQVLSTRRLEKALHDWEALNMCH
eukprot:bmy_22151T0